MQPLSQLQIQLIQEGTLQPPPAMAATRPRLRGNPRIRASVPPPRHLFLYMPHNARARRHEIAASPCRRCMPPLPSAVGETGTATATSAGGGSGQGDGQRMWRLELVWGLRCRPSGGDMGGLVAV
jgi:hypothetical protein